VKSRAVWRFTSAQITELGEKYLSGEFDASTLDDDGSGSERPASA
jgi:hypothetical protein